MVYVSTAYSNCDLVNVDEVVYSQTFTAADIEKLTELVPDEVLEKVKYLKFTTNPSLCLCISSGS